MNILDRILGEAMELDRAQRAALVGHLLDSLEEEPDEKPEDVEEAWRVEIERRLDDMDAGRVKVVPWEDLRHRLIERINARTR